MAGAPSFHVSRRVQRMSAPSRTNSVLNPDYVAASSYAPPNVPHNLKPPRRSRELSHHLLWRRALYHESAILSKQRHGFQYSQSGPCGAVPQYGGYVSRAPSGQDRRRSSHIRRPHCTSCLGALERTQADICLGLNTMDTHFDTDLGLGSHFPHRHGPRGMYISPAIVWRVIIDAYR